MQPTATGGTLTIQATAAEVGDNTGAAVRMQLLQMVLAAQTAMRRDGPYCDLTLLRLEDLRAIRHLWRQHPDYPQDGSDPARDITQRTTGLDIGPSSPDDARRLDLPQVDEPDTAVEQLILTLFDV